MNPQKLAESGWRVVTDPDGAWAAVHPENPLVIHGTPEGEVYYLIPKVVPPTVVKGFGRSLITC